MSIRLYLAFVLQISISATTRTAMTLPRKKEASWNVDPNLQALTFEARPYSMLLLQRRRSR